MRACGLLDSLCDSLMASGVPADVLTETVCAVAEVIRGNSENQTQLGDVMAPSTPPRPALVVLLMSMVNEKQPLALRCAVLYCYQCFLHRNQDGQAQLAQTLLPSSSEQGSYAFLEIVCISLILYFSKIIGADFFSGEILCVKQSGYLDF